MKNRYFTYGGADKDEEKTLFCTKCNTKHTLPAREWVLIKGPVSSSIACMDSVAEFVTDDNKT